MTFEEIQKTIEGMLAVQKELQETQINFRSDLQAFREEQANFQTNFQANFQAGLQTLREEQVELSRREGILIEEVNRLIVLSNKNEVNINRLIGYSLTDESDRITLLERLMKVESRLEELEKQLNGD